MPTALRPLWLHLVLLLAVLATALGVLFLMERSAASGAPSVLPFVNVSKQGPPGGGGNPGGGNPGGGNPGGGNPGGGNPGGCKPNCQPSRG